MSRISLLFVFLMSSYQLFPQSVTNVIAKQEGEQIQISYDLSGNPGESYEIKLALSRDGGKSFTESPAKVTGAVNRWEAAGAGKLITWEAKKDLGEFEGNLQFKVTATGKGGVSTPVTSTTQVTSSIQGSSANVSNSASAENEMMNFTIASVFDITDGFKVIFKMRAKRDTDVAILNNTQATDQFGNVYTIVSADIESLGVLNGKSRKFITGARKEGEMMLKISKMNSASISGRMLKSLVLETNIGTFALNDLPKL